MRNMEEMIARFDEYENNSQPDESKVQMKRTVNSKATTRSGGIRDISDKPKIQLFSRTRTELQALRRINAEAKARKVSQNTNQSVNNQVKGVQQVIETASVGRKNQTDKVLDATVSDKPKIQLFSKTRAELQALRRINNEYSEAHKKAEERENSKRENKKQKELDKKFKQVQKGVTKAVKREDKELRKLRNRITPPKEHRTWFNRLGNVINLEQHEYDVYKDDIKDYKKGRISKEELELEWEEIQDYEDAKSDIKLRAAWGTFKLALIGVGLAAAVHFGGQLVNSAYEYGQDLTQGFWDETKQNLEEQREQYELFHGDYLPNGELKRQLTAEEYEALTPSQKKHIAYIPSANAEISEAEDGNYVVTFPDDENMTADTTREDSTEDMERE